jgi:hypothetical protein
VSATWVEGRPAAALRREGERAWRARVADAARLLGPVRGVRLDFVLAPGRWVDLDSLVEVAVAGLRDGGVTLDALVATKAEGAPTGLAVEVEEPVGLAAAAPPGPAAVRIASPVARPGDRAAKRALRGRIADAWGERAPLEGPVWADVALATRGSLLATLEPALDALEPVLGRDPRGQPRQEFFPHDDRILWLRVRRTPPDTDPLTLTLGSLPG